MNKNPRLSQRVIHLDLGAHGQIIRILDNGMVRVEYENSSMTAPCNLDELYPAQDKKRWRFEAVSEMAKEHDLTLERAGEGGYSLPAYPGDEGQTFPTLQQVVNELEIRWWRVNRYSTEAGQATSAPTHPERSVTRK